MTQFVEIPSTSKSFCKRKPVYGVGINDSKYNIVFMVCGRRIMCPYYSSWTDMLQRIYCEKSARKKTNYKECSVCDEWLTFSNFRKWMKTQDWEGKQLDKDLLVNGNKIYGPGTCIFVSSEMNALLTNREALRGEFPQGVCFNKWSGKYAAACCVRGKKAHIGYFSSVNNASYSYLLFKSSLIKNMAYEQEALSNPKLQAALLRHAEIFKEKANKLFTGSGCYDTVQIQ